MNTCTITAEEIMTGQLVTTTPEMHVLDAIERLLAHRVSGLPVISREGRLVGRFTERSAIRAADLAPVNGNSGIDEAMRAIQAGTIRCQGLLLSDAQDVFEAVAILLQNRVSAAPVVQKDGTYLGVFSEKSAMRVFIELCWEQMPSAPVTAWLDNDPGRLIEESAGLDQVLDRFQDTSFRRLIMLREGQFVGQVTRKDALQAALNLRLGPWMATRSESSRTGSDTSMTVQNWMLGTVPTVSRELDVLVVAQTFIESGMRQLPVMDGDRLIGQISRCDLLRAVQKHFPQPKAAPHAAAPLYLSSVNRKDPESIMR